MWVCIRKCQYAISRLGYKVPDLQRGYLIHLFVADCGTDMKFGYHWQVDTLKDIGCSFILFYKIVNNLTSDYTRYPIPHLQESNYDLRRRTTVWQTCARTHGFKSSFHPNCLSEWEKVDPEIRPPSSVNTFKRKLLSIICPPPMLVYRVHDPTGLSILTQLCVGLSKLNVHIFKHSFRDTLNPLCPTNDSVEDTERYFLLCRTYDADRLDLLNSVKAILLPHGLINLSMKSY